MWCNLSTLGRYNSLKVTEIVWRSSKRKKRKRRKDVQRAKGEAGEKKEGRKEGRGVFTLTTGFGSDGSEVGSHVEDLGFL
jgi:hypothetical protein